MFSDFNYFPVFLQHPVYCVNVVGTQNAHNLISVSTDGKMCSWSLDMLSQPQVILPLINPLPLKKTLGQKSWNFIPAPG